MSIVASLKNIASWAFVPSSRRCGVAVAANAAAATTVIATGLASASLVVPCAVATHVVMCALENPTPQEWDALKEEMLASRAAAGFRRIQRQIPREWRSHEVK